jgi:hypothetical protein
MFTWRLSRNFEKQPDKESADFRKQECLFYGCVDDDGGHLFVKRKAVKEIWHGLGMEQPRSKFDTKISRVLSELFFYMEYYRAIMGASGGQARSGLHHLVALVEEHK